MPEAKPIAIVIPSLNPDGNLPAYVAALRARTDWPILLVDDGSDAAHVPVFDACVAAVPGVTLLRHGVNRGKGRALKTAFAHLLAETPGLLGCVTCDSDGQHLPDDVLRCAEALRATPDALVLGCRVFGLSHVPFRSRFGNTTIRALFALATGRHFTDTQTGLRAISAPFMRELLGVAGERFDFETRMLLALGPRPLVEVPIETVYLDGNKSSHFNPLRDSMRILGIVCGHILSRLWRFTAASLASFALDIALFKLLHAVVLKDLGWGRLALSVGLARVASATFNYLANLHFVFGGMRARRSLAKYAALALCIVAASYALTAAALGASSFARGHVATTKAAIDLFLFLASYVVQRLCVFGR
jgi:dolichol-phosphate mannosyltransferase